MATGHSDDDALLGLPDDGDKIIRALLPSLQGIQHTMSSVATGMEKMGEAWAALARNPSSKPEIATTSGSSIATGTAKGTKRPLDDEEGEGEEELDYMDDEGSDNDISHDADVDSLIGKSTVSEVKPEEDMLDRIQASLLDDSDLGPNTNEKLAAIANRAFEKQLPLDTVKTKEEAYPRPKNCHRLMVPRVNGEIWKRMKSNTLLKSRDLRFMNIQKAVTKSACAVTRLAEKLLPMEKSSEKDAMIKQATDAILLLGHANTSLSMQRRQLLRPVLKGDHGLCDASIPVTDNLFGDDLPKTLKEIRQSNVGREYQRPYYTKNWRGGRSQNFALSKSRKPYPRQKQQ